MFLSISKKLQFAHLLPTFHYNFVNINGHPPHCLQQLTVPLGGYDVELCRNHPVLYSQSLYQCLRDGGGAEVARHVQSEKVHNNVTGGGQVDCSAWFELWRLAGRSWCLNTICQGGSNRHGCQESVGLHNKQNFSRGDRRESSVLRATPRGLHKKTTQQQTKLR